MKLPSVESSKTQLIFSQHRFRYWLGAVRQQAISGAYVDPDLCRLMASLGHSVTRRLFIRYFEVLKPRDWS